MAWYHLVLFVIGFGFAMRYVFKHNLPKWSILPLGVGLWLVSYPTVWLYWHAPTIMFKLLAIVVGVIGIMMVYLVFDLLVRPAKKN